MCGLLSAEQVEQFEAQIELSLADLHEEAKRQPRVDLKTAELVAARCRLLLEHYSEFSERERYLVTGAVRYFLLADDPFSDEHFATGFDDDAKIVNHVLEKLGIDGMFIEL